MLYDDGTKHKIYFIDPYNDTFSIYTAIRGKWTPPMVGHYSQPYFNSDSPLMALYARMSIDLGKPGLQHCAKVGYDFGIFHLKQKYIRFAAAQRNSEIICWRYGEHERRPCAEWCSVQGLRLMELLKVSVFKLQSLIINR